MTTSTLKELFDPKTLTIAGTTVALLVSLWILGVVVFESISGLTDKVEAHNEVMSENDKKNVEVLTQIRDDIRWQNQLLFNRQ